MAKYNRVEDPVRKAKEFNSISFEKQIRDERTLKTFAKARRNNQLYQEGYSLGVRGGELESATELVEENGQMIPKCEHRNFKAGYKKGLEQLQANIQASDNSKTR